VGGVDFADKADLNSTGVLKSTQVPDLSITSVDVVADQTARLNLTAEEGDVAIQTDINETFVLSTNDPTVDSNWKKVQLDVVGAIDGQTITPGQVGTGSNRSKIVADEINANQYQNGMELIGQKTSGNFSVDTSGFSELLVYFSASSGGGDPVFLTVDGITTSDYETTFLDGSKSSNSQGHVVGTDTFGGNRAVGSVCIRSGNGDVAIVGVGADRNYNPASMSQFTMQVIGSNTIQSVDLVSGTSLSSNDIDGVLTVYGTNVK
jgi:hypothetical protein